MSPIESPTNKIDSNKKDTHGFEKENKNVHFFKKLFVVMWM